MPIGAVQAAILGSGGAPAPSILGVQDFSTFTEVDPGSYYTVTSTTITTTLLPRNVLSYVGKDYGAAKFSGNFKHRFKLTPSATPNEVGLQSPWVMSNLEKDPAYLDNNAGDCLDVYYFNASAAAAALRIREIYGGTPTVVVYGTNLVRGTAYYLEVERNEAVGANGTLYLRVFTDSGYSSAYGADISIALTGKLDFRYLLMACSYNGGTTQQISSTIENLDIVSNS